MKLYRSFASGGLDHPDWLFELKYDGFRALAWIEGQSCRRIIVLLTVSPSNHPREEAI